MPGASTGVQPPRPVASRVRMTCPAATARCEKRTSLSGGAARISVARTSSLAARRTPSSRLDRHALREPPERARVFGDVQGGSERGQRPVRPGEPSCHFPLAPPGADATHDPEHRFARPVGDRQDLDVVREHDHRMPSEGGDDGRDGGGSKKGEGLGAPEDIIDTGTSKQQRGQPFWAGITLSPPAAL